MLIFFFKLYLFNSFILINYRNFTLIKNVKNLPMLVQTLFATKCFDCLKSLQCNRRGRFKSLTSRLLDNVLCRLDEKLKVIDLNNVFNILKFNERQNLKV